MQGPAALEVWDVWLNDMPLSCFGQGHEGVIRDPGALTW
jgi:hypothetical protein